MWDQSIVDGGGEGIQVYVLDILDRDEMRTFG